MLFPPPKDEFQSREATIGPSDARKVVVLLGEAEELDLAFHRLQHRIELLGLLDGTPEIAVAVDDEERRLDVLHIADRRELRLVLGVVVGVVRKSALVVVPEVARPEERNPGALREPLAD